MGGGLVIDVKSLEGFWEESENDWGLRGRTKHKTVPVIVVFEEGVEERRFYFIASDMKEHTLSDEDLQVLFNNPAAHRVE